MYIVEGNAPHTQFTDLGTSVYYAIVTMTTVGFGDVTPVTPTGKFLSSMVMLLGYTIIAVPTGIVTATFVDETSKPVQHGCCPSLRTPSAKERSILLTVWGEISVTAISLTAIDATTIGVTTLQNLFCW